MTCQSALHGTDLAHVRDETWLKRPRTRAGPAPIGNAAYRLFDNGFAGLRSVT